MDTAKIQAALEKRADQETAVLPHLTLPDTQESGKPAQSAGTPLSQLFDPHSKKSAAPAAPFRALVDAFRPLLVFHLHA